MADFTPQEIERFLQEFFDTVGARQYIGARYVPIFGRAGEDTVEWDDLAPYEPLTVVMHEGVSYVSRRYVPQGIQITDTAYWVETYRFNAQVEQYRQEVLSFQDEIDDRVPFPDASLYPVYGTLGQVLSTLADGTTRWVDPVVPSDAQAEQVISDWLNEHPEATTTVEDGSLTYAKFAAALRAQLPTNTADNRTVILNSTDYDNITDIGNYKCASAAAAQSMTHCPTGVGHMLTVFTTGASTQKMQLLVDNNERIYVRMLGHDWVNVMSGFDYDTVSANDSDDYNAIADGTDYTTLDIGNYKCTSSAHAQTMLNCPTTLANKVHVFEGPSSSVVYRVVYTASTIPQIWVNASGSTTWYRVSTYDSFALVNYARESIAANTDYDTINVAGNYVCATNATATTLTHSPTRDAHSLTVMQLNSASNLVQVVIDARNDIYIREYLTSSASWSTWRKLTIINDLSQVSLNQGNDYVAIPDNTDYTTIGAGNYKCTSAAHASTMVNCPVAVSHKLHVFETVSSANVYRFLYPNMSTPSVWMQFNNEPWVELLTSLNGIKSVKALVTDSNYATVLPDFDLATPNVVYSLIDGLDQILHRPEGNLNVAGAGATSGAPSGTLITVRGGTYTTDGNYCLVQFFAQQASPPANTNQGRSAVIAYRFCNYISSQYQWSEWSYGGRNLTMRATNRFIQESRIQAGTADFDDMNNAPCNTIYQIDLDAVSMAHNPLSGHSCVLITFSPSYISQHGSLQLCAGVLSGRVELFYRYGYQNAPDDFRWTSWAQVTGTVIP